MLLADVIHISSTLNFSYEPRLNSQHVIQRTFNRTFHGFFVYTSSLILVPYFHETCRRLAGCHVWVYATHLGRLVPPLQQVGSCSDHIFRRSITDRVSTDFPRRTLARAVGGRTCESQASYSRSTRYYQIVNVKQVEYTTFDG